MSKFVLFHDDSDGYCSALAAMLSMTWSDAKYISVQYGQPFPEQIPLTKETEILVVDFSYKREILEEVHAAVGKITVIDHHKTAQKDLEGLPYAIFDMEESGATLTWKYFHNSEPPNLFKFVGDRDLWRFKYKESRWLEHGINASGRSKDLMFWLQLYQDHVLFQSTLETGKILQENVDGICKTFVKAKKYRVFDFGKMVGYPSMQCVIFNNTSLISEMAEAMYKHLPDVEFVMSYFILPDTAEVVFSLRCAAGKKLDLGQLAKCFGGGGHARAAGFKLSYKDAAQFIVPDWSGESHECVAHLAAPVLQKYDFGTLTA